MLGEVRRLVNGYWNPSNPSFPAAFPSCSLKQPFLYNEVILYFSLILCPHLPRVKIISERGVMILPQVVHKRKRRQDKRETERKLYKSQKLSENCVPESKFVNVEM